MEGQNLHSLKNLRKLGEAATKRIRNKIRKTEKKGDTRGYVHAKGETETLLRNAKKLKYSTDLRNRLVNDLPTSLTTGFNLYRTGELNAKAAIARTWITTPLKDLPAKGGKTKPPKPPPKEDVILPPRHAKSIDKVSITLKPLPKKKDFEPEDIVKVLFWRITKLGKNLFSTIHVKQEVKSDRSVDAADMSNKTLEEVDVALFGVNSANLTDQMRFDILVSLLDNLKVEGSIIVPYVNIIQDMKTDDEENNPSNSTQDTPSNGRKLVDNPSKLLNLNSFKCKLVTYLRIRNADEIKVTGITKRMQYLATSLSPISIHAEDEDIASVNVHEAGASKALFVLPPSARRPFLQHLRNALAASYTKIGKTNSEHCMGIENKSDLNCLAEHKQILVTPGFLSARGIPFKLIFLKPGCLITFASGAIHFGMSLGLSLGNAKNHLDCSFGYLEDEQKGFCDPDCWRREGQFAFEESAIPELKKSCIELSRLGGGQKVTKIDFADLNFVYTEGKPNELKLVTMPDGTFHYCELCNLEFDTRHKLRDHNKNELECINKIAIKSNVFLCPYPACSRQFDRFSRLQEHYEAPSGHRDSDVPLPSAEDVLAKYGKIPKSKRREPKGTKSSSSSKRGGKGEEAPLPTDTTSTSSSPNAPVPSPAKTPHRVFKSETEISRIKPAKTFKLVAELGARINTPRSKVIEKTSTSDEDYEAFSPEEPPTTKESSTQLPQLTKRGGKRKLTNKISHPQF